MEDAVPFKEVAKYLKAEYEEPVVDIQFVNAPETREECLFDSKQEDVLFDAYQMLRWAGVPREKLDPMAMTIELTTIYTREELERYFEDVIGKTAYEE